MNKINKYVIPIINVVLMVVLSFIKTLAPPILYIFAFAILCYVIKITITIGFENRIITIFTFVLIVLICILIAIAEKIAPQNN